MNSKPSSLPVLDGLRAILGSKYILTDREQTASFVRDWSGDYISAPLCIALPGSVDEISALLRFCTENELHVVPQGGNTGLVAGCHVTDSERTIIINLKRLNRIKSIDAANYTMEVEAGCIVQDVREQAEANKLLFPLSFGAQGSAQIGGALATNAGGLNVLRYGMARDLVLGVEVVLPDGQVLDTLSNLRKDNRGLDLKQLFLGTEGTLGMITAASLKLFPQITNQETAFVAMKDVASAVEFYQLARGHCSDLLTAFELIPRACVELAVGHQTSLRDPLASPYPVYVLFEIASSGPLDLRDLIETMLELAIENNIILDGTMAESGQQANALWAIREAMVEAQASYRRHLRTDISVPVSDIPKFIDRAKALLAKIAPQWTPLAYGHIGDGNVHFNALPPGDMADGEIEIGIKKILVEIYSIVDELNGSISAEHGIGRSRREAFASRQQPVAGSLSQTIKEILDPGGILNPGCLYPPLGAHRQTP